jgi:hypothetical protein
MTIKVFMTNGKVEEFPNAYIYWEWDESEKGTDSGFRINSMDKNFTSVVAFVHSGECAKIEITSEKCDNIFKSPPKEKTIGLEHWKIFSAINEECKRQDEKWGEQNHPMRGENISTLFSKEDLVYPHDSGLQTLLGVVRFRHKKGKAGWFDILQKEVCEAFLETDPVKQREGMTQVAAVAVQIIEYLDRRIEEAKREKGD